ncbi:MAG: hypothetical protein J0I99_01445 [Devosia sp.]|uniref:hypothetical protein n=1 Tax=Devosia sp. TaxID=1871048 RepID=UPI001AC87430|nr:hypothetical protein [Devosia sp.]MBN9314383.1 hypothetical protein [Devosia sp.]
MTPILSRVMKSGRAAIVAVTLGAAALTAMPVQAQSGGNPSFNFQFGIQGGGDNFSYRFDNGKRFKRECLTNNEVRRGLQRMGWDDIRFVDRHGVRVKVVADWGRRTYAMTVNKCTGRVTDIERLSRPYRPGFHFQFRF